MEALKVVMKKNNISIDSSSSCFHGDALFAFGFSLNATSTSSSNEWLINSRASHHMVMDKTIFSSLNDFSTKKIFVGADRSLSVIGFGIIQVDHFHFNDVLCVPSPSYNPLLAY
jgi:hypothetical protein